MALRLKIFDSKRPKVADVSAIYMDFSHVPVCAYIYIFKFCIVYKHMHGVAICLDKSNTQIFEYCVKHEKTAKCQKQPCVLYHGQIFQNGSSKNSRHFQIF